MKDTRIYLEHILESISRIEAYTEGNRKNSCNKPWCRMVFCEICTYWRNLRGEFPMTRKTGIQGLIGAEFQA